jgi:hypothetical protein
MQYISFNKLCEIIEESPLNTSGDDGKSIEIIRKGLFFNKKDYNFWEDFVSLCGNADAMSELLDVPREKITGWAGRIRKLIDETKNSSQEQDDLSKKSKMISTGVIDTNKTDVDTRPFPS